MRFRQSSVIVAIAFFVALASVGMSAAKVPRGAKAVSAVSLRQSQDAKYRCLGTVAGIKLAAKPKKKSQVYFIGYGALQRNATAAARKAKGKKKRALFALATKYKGLKVNGAASCKVSTPTHSTPTSPLRFSIANKSGLALKSGGQASSALARPGAHTATVGSNLQAIAPDGAITDAVASGVAAVSKFLIAPNGKVYVLFSSRTNLADTSLGAAFGGAGCLLAEVDAASGLPVCIDNTLQSITWNQTASSANPAIQFDAAGGIYYVGQVSGKTVLRRYRDGAITDLVNDNISIGNFLVLPDGSVIISGTTMSTAQEWVRRVTPNGGIQTVFVGPSGGLSSLHLYPDGNVYFGVWGGDAFGIKRYLTNAGQVDSRYWISGNVNGLQRSAYFNIDDLGLCAVPGRESFCGMYGIAVRDLITTSDGKIFGSAGHRTQAGLLTQYYPTVDFPTTIVKNVTLAQGAGTKLILAGMDASSGNTMTLYDTSDSSETTLLGADNEIEIYHVNFAAGENKVLFDGLRFADNKYVLGQVDLATREVSVTTTIAAKWADFQTFR